MIDERSFSHSPREVTLLEMLERGASAKDLGTAVDELWRHYASELYSCVCRRMRPNRADPRDYSDEADAVILDVRERAFELLCEQMRGSTGPDVEKRRLLLEYRRDQARPFLDYLVGLAGSRHGGSIANIIQGERRRRMRFVSPMGKDPQSSVEETFEAAFERLVSKQTYADASQGDNRLSLNPGRPDVALEHRENVDSLVRALVSLESSTDRLIMALRHGVMGAPAIIDAVVLKDKPISAFVDWAIETLHIERAIALKIAGRLRQRRTLMRNRLTSTDARNN